MRPGIHRRTRARARRQSIMLPLGVGALLLAVVVIVKIWCGPCPPELDERLCPKAAGPVGATVLLLDTSDPLTSKHWEELIRLVDRLAGQSASGYADSMSIAPKELFAVYQMTQDPGAPKQLVEVCRPKDRTWCDDLCRGRRYGELDWERFKDAIANAFPERESEAQPTSPLLETIAVLAPRHVPGKRGDERFKVHLIVFSDLLQHSPRFSHYGPYPDAKDVRHRARDLLTDLTGAQVSLFRLERPRYTKWQTERHYYWWTELVMEQGGRIEWQDSI